MAQRSLLLAIAPLFWPKLAPLGLGFLQSYLAQQAINSDILDLNHQFYNLADESLKKAWLVSCNLALEKNILTLVKRNHPGEFRSAIESMLGYEIIGLSCFKSNFLVTLEIIRLLKSKNKELKVILGGPEIARQFFKGRARFASGILKLADYLVVGEGEAALLNFLKTTGKAARITTYEQLDDLEQLDFPRYQGLSLKSYPKKDTLPLQFSRGCIRKCLFCSERLLYQGMRYRKVASIIDEIGYHKSKNHINNFIFFDSMLNSSPKRLEDLCDAIIANFGAIPWEAQMAVRNEMSPGLLKKIKKSGCYNLFIGLESGSDKTLKKMQKGFTVKDALGFFKKLKQSGIFFGVSMIVGYPGETEADFRESLDFILRNHELIPKIEQVNPFTYYDGTQADKRGDYKINQVSIRRMEIFVDEIKRRGFKYTNAFLGNLIEKP